MTPLALPSGELEIVRFVDQYFHVDNWYKWFLSKNSQILQNLPIRFHWVDFVEFKRCSHGILSGLLCKTAKRRFGDEKMNKYFDPKTSILPILGSNSKTKIHHSKS